MIERVCRCDYSRPGKPDIDWEDTHAKQALVSDLVNDALAVLAELTGPDASARTRPRMRWGCWRWSRVKTWSRPRIPTAPTDAGASRGGWRRIG